MYRLPTSSTRTDTPFPDTTLFLSFRPDAGDVLHQLALAVAGNPGEADDLAVGDVEADAVDPGDAVAVEHPQTVDVQHRPARGGRPLVHPEQHLAPDPQLGQFLAAGRRGGAVRHHLAAAHHRHGGRQLRRVSWWGRVGQYG